MTVKISLADLQKSGNPLWRKAAGGLPGPKPRKKRFTGLSSESKAWVREMSRGPGRFFQTSRIINWLNWRGNHFAKAKIISTQRALAFVEMKSFLHRPIFRDCADHDGVCPYSKFPCDPSHRKYVVRFTRYGPKKLDDGE